MVRPMAANIDFGRAEVAFRNCGRHGADPASREMKT